MKKIIYFLLATISISNLSFSQETEFKFDKEGFTDFVVTQCEGKTQAELYKKALDWVSVTYKNPKEVIKAQIENDYIRIEGSSNSLICLNILGKKYNNATLLGWKVYRFTDMMIKDNSLTKFICLLLKNNLGSVEGGVDG